jgi:hypothetical protein
MTFDLTTFDGACAFVQGALWSSVQQTALTEGLRPFAVVFATEHKGQPFPAPLAVGVALESGLSEGTTEAFSELVKSAVTLTKALGTVLIVVGYLKLDRESPAAGLAFSHGVKDAAVAPPGFQKVLLIHLEHGKETCLFFARITTDDDGLVELGTLEKFGGDDSVGVLFNLMGRKRAEA